MRTSTSSSESESKKKQFDSSRKEDRIKLKEQDDPNLRKRQRGGKPYTFSTDLFISTSPPAEDPESAVIEDQQDELNEVVSDDEQEEMEKKGYRIATETMTENVFSLIFTAPVDSSAFWLGIFVSLFQILMPSLALLDLIVFSNDTNPLQVPNSVSFQVRIIGAMALILAVSQYWDFMEAIDKLEHGPPPRSAHTPAGATCW